jgi:hypothetical protein
MAAEIAARYLQAESAHQVRGLLALENGTGLLRARGDETVVRR